MIYQSTIFYEAEMGLSIYLHFFKIWYLTSVI